MIDFDNVQSLIDYYHDFTASHDLANIDLSEFRNIHIGDEAEMASAEHLRELMEKDTCGECLGKFYHQLKMEKSLEKHDSVYAVFDDDDRLLAIIKWATSSSFCMELLEYSEDFFVGFKFVVLSSYTDKKPVIESDLTFYVPSGNVVTEMITVYDLTSINKARVDKIELEYIEGKASVKSNVASLYKMTSKGFELEKQSDRLNPPEPRRKPKRVNDNQKKLCKMLEEEVKQVTTLDQAIDAFFKVVSLAKPNDEEMLLYEVGCYSFDGPDKNCEFCLVRQTPTRDDEFYQMHMELIFEAGEEEQKLDECEWHEKGDDDLRDYVHQSNAYNVLKNKQFSKIRVWVDET